MSTIPMLFAFEIPNVETLRMELAWILKCMISISSKVTNFERVFWNVFGIFHQNSFNGLFAELIA